MKIVKAYPPNIDQIRARFKINNRVVFSYGDILYNPGGGHVDDSLMEHEKTHSEQQGDDVEGWWQEYIENKDFRFGQEVLAYQKQYQWFKENRCQKPNGKIRHERLRKLLVRIAKDLSGEIYGFGITYEEAKKVIKNS